jgi:hypothetical protein
MNGGSLHPCAIARCKRCANNLTIMAQEAVDRINAELKNIQTTEQTRLEEEQTGETFESLTETFILGTSAAFAAELLLMPVEGQLQKHLVPRNSSLHNPSMFRPFEYKLDLKGVAKDAKQILFTRAPITGLLLCSYEFAKQRLRTHLPESISKSPLKVGLIAGPTAQFVESAIWSPIASLQSTPKTTSIKGLYKGFWNNYFASVPYIASFFAFGEWSTSVAWKRYKDKHPDADSLPVSWLLTTGVASGSLAVIVSTPIEMLRQIVLKEWSHRDKIRASIKQNGWMNGLKLFGVNSGFTDRLKADLPTLLFRQAPRTGTRKVLFAAIKGSPARIVLRNILRTVSKSAVRGLSRGGGIRVALKVVFTRIARLFLRRGKPG